MDYTIIIILVVAAFVGGIIFTQIQDIEFDISDIWIPIERVQPTEREVIYTPTTLYKEPIGPVAPYTPTTLYREPIGPEREVFGPPAPVKRVVEDTITPIKTVEIIKSKEMLLSSPSVPEHLRFISDFIYTEQISIITSAILNTDNEEDYNELVRIYQEIRKEGIREDMNFQLDGITQYYILNDKQYTFGEVIDISVNNIRNKGLSEGWIKE